MYMLESMNASDSVQLHASGRGGAPPAWNMERGPAGKAGLEAVASSLCGMKPICRPMLDASLPALRPLSTHNGISGDVLGSASVMFCLVPIDREILELLDLLVRVLL